MPDAAWVPRILDLLGDAEHQVDVGALGVGHGSLDAFGEDVTENVTVIIACQ